MSVEQPLAGRPHHLRRRGRGGRVCTQARCWSGGGQLRRLSPAPTRPVYVLQVFNPQHSIGSRQTLASGVDELGSRIRIDAVEWPSSLTPISFHHFMYFTAPSLSLTPCIRASASFPHRRAASIAFCRTAWAMKSFFKCAIYHMRSGQPRCFPKDTGAAATPTCLVRLTARVDPQKAAPCSAHVWLRVHRALCTKYEMPERRSTSNVQCTPMCGARVDFV